jgi:hypothetical protein
MPEKAREKGSGIGDLQSELADARVGHFNAGEHVRAGSCPGQREEIV